MEPAAQACHPQLLSPPLTLPCSPVSARPGADTFLPRWLS